jgi:hypothetical protein
MSFFKRFELAMAFICVVLIIPGLAQLEVEVTSDPSQVKLHYYDLNNFLAALDLIEDGHDPVETVQKYYLSRASKAFQDQIDSRNITAEKMTAFITDNPETVKKLRELPKNLRLQEDAIRQALTDLTKVIPEPIFLPVYYMVVDRGGFMGEPSEFGIKVAMSRTSDDYSRICPLIVHEMIHVQQALAVGIETYQRIYGPDMSLLSLSLREGVATYLTRIALGKPADKKAYEYFNDHEKALWDKFQKEKLNKQPGDWMWSKPAIEGQPRDMGYHMGAAIIKHFYTNAEDKELAMKEILSITDYEGFLKKSGYGSKFDK